MKYYYKTHDGKSFLKVNSKLADNAYIEISADEWTAHMETTNVSLTPDELALIQQKQAKLSRIRELKKLLADTDYQALKYAEGMISEEDYAPIKAQRQAWRDEINRLEAELEA